MFLVTHKNGTSQVIDRAPDSYELRECSISAIEECARCVGTGSVGGEALGDCEPTDVVDCPVCGGAGYVTPNAELKGRSGEAA